ncbi:MAG TPA: DUF3604 domain-containing protein [Chlamydiales bacterium]|nr:DUF3604 domain-containing protein [Chlamydiales bacterium]
MRRSVCYCEPKFVKAGQKGTWKFIYTTANDLPKGTKIKFAIESYDRDFDWEIPQTDVKKKSNIIWAEMPDGKTISAKETDDEYFYSYEFTLPKEVLEGNQFSICIGTALKDDENSGNQAQHFNQRRKPFHISVDTTGKGQYKESDVFYLDIRGNVLSNLKIIAPSYVSKNKRFDVIVRFEDAYGNLTSNAPEDTLIELSYENLRENFSWKIFVPETGFITLPNLYFNENGVYRIQLKNLKTGDLFYSSPIQCFENSELSLFWGNLHGESERYDSEENIESCLRYFRDDMSYQFYGISPFDKEEQTSNDLWKNMNQNVSEFTEEDRFICFSGFQYVGESKAEGIKQFIYSKENKPILRKDDLKSNSAKKIYKTYSPKDLISIPTFTMGPDSEYDFKSFNNEFEKVVEIYNAWGSSECAEKEGNLFPIRKESKKKANYSPDGSIMNALNNNCRFGFVAGGLDDRGIYDSFYESDQKQYTPGLTAIIAKNQTRESLFQALSAKSCFATTGAKMLININVANSPMGSELSTQTKPGLEYNRHISGFVIGIKSIEFVELIRNGKVLKKFEPNKTDFEFAFDDSEKIQDVVIDLKSEEPPFVYYYLRAKQEDGHMAWSSPIWVDYVATKPTKKVIKK